MWPMDEKTQTFEALSYWDKLRVGRSLVRGEAPSNPRLAEAAIELAESYERQSRRSLAVMRWTPVVLGIIYGGVAVINAIEGSVVLLLLSAATVLLAVGFSLVDPAIRRKNMVRAAEASRRSLAASDGSS